MGAMMGMNHARPKQFHDQVRVFRLDLEATWAAACGESPFGPFFLCNPHRKITTRIVVTTGFDVRPLLLLNADLGPCNRNDRH